MKMLSKAVLILFSMPNLIKCCGESFFAPEPKHEPTPSAQTTVKKKSENKTTLPRQEIDSLIVTIEHIRAKLKNLEKLAE